MHIAHTLDTLNFDNEQEIDVVIYSFVVAKNVNIKQIVNNRE